jgi:hypothetical protein
MDLNPSDPTCSVPVFAPGNGSVFFDGRMVDCQELPTGRYSISVLHGIAGGRSQPDSANPPISETGYDILGGRYSGQSWTIPNELGPADLDYNPAAQAQIDATRVLAHQGPPARIAVVETNASNGVRDGCDKDSLADVPEACCDAVKHLCGLPLCDVESDEGYSIRRMKATDLDNNGKPTCVPFLMPSKCCP